MVGRERLLQLEKEGIYVFHGSPDIVDVLIPRQAQNEDRETGKMVNDGEPAVFATQYADIAIFKAIMDARGLAEPSVSSFGIDGQSLYFSATKNLLEHIKNKTGKVYVLNKKEFGDFEAMQCRSCKPVTPIEVVEVTMSDLPEKVEVIL